MVLWKFYMVQSSMIGGRVSARRLFFILHLQLFNQPMMGAVIVARLMLLSRLATVSYRVFPPFVSFLQMPHKNTQEFALY
jgi:hypothetical protein